MTKRVFMALCVLVICTIGVKLYGLCTFRLNGVISCEYTYSYQADDGNSVCSETVSLSNDDIEALLEMLSTQLFWCDLDYESGYSENFNLCFFTQDGTSHVLYMRYPRGSGYMKKSDGGLVCVLQNDDESALFEILGKYERHTKILQAG